MEFDIDECDAGDPSFTASPQTDEVEEEDGDEDRFGDQDRYDCCCAICGKCSASH